MGILGGCLEMLKNKTVLIVLGVIILYYAYKCGLVSKFIGGRSKEEASGKKKNKKSKKSRDDDDDDDDDDSEKIEKANKADLVARKTDDIHRKQIDPPKSKAKN